MERKENLLNASEYDIELKRGARIAQYEVLKNFNPEPEGNCEGN